MNASVLSRQAAPPVDRERRFVKRVHGLRTLGLGLGFFPVAAVFWQNGEPPLLWALLLVNGFAWPHLARWLAVRSTTPVQVEYRSLLVDSLMGGVWVALMRFNLLPSVALLTMLAMDKLSVGGPRLLLRGLLLQGVACALTAAANGWAFAAHTGAAVALATLPFMVLYPLAISAVMHALARQVRRQNHELARISSTDGLSDLLNRGAWEETVAMTLQRCRRSGGHASLLMIDIDRFKFINDTLGHSVGDEVISAVGHVIRDCMRARDSAGRYGGDEFAVVCGNTQAGEARALAERIRTCVEDLRLPEQPDLRLTCSIGLAAAQTRHGNLRAWMHDADAALYRAKNDGRNQVSADASTPAVSSAVPSTI